MERGVNNRGQACMAAEFNVQTFSFLSLASRIETFFDACSQSPPARRVAPSLRFIFKGVWEDAEVCA